MLKMQALLALAAMLAGACTGTASRPLTPPGRVCVRTVWRQLLSSMGAAEAV